MNSIKKERQQIFNDVYSNIIPKRVPIDISFSLEVVAGYAGLNVKDVLWNPTLIESTVMELAQKVFSDTCILGGIPRIPSSTQAMGSINSVMSSKGFMQHPNVVGLLEDEYDMFIEDPYACIIETILPRLYKEMNISIYGPRSLFAALQGMNAKNEFLSKFETVRGKLIQKFGYYERPRGASSGVYACMDFLSDNIRSFTGICLDIKKRPEKILAANEALYPYNYKVGLPTVIHREGEVFIPLHMPPFMREKDFEKLWWPTFKRQLVDYASLGIHTRIFCEGNWMRYLEYLQDLPSNTRIQFEYGDPKTIKRKLGNKFILIGLFPISILTHFSKQQCIDETKKFLDIMAPGGNYIFTFDKIPLTYSDINLENLIAVSETVREYGVYDNAGQKAGSQFNKNDYKHSNSPPFTSKYYRTWEEYKKLFPETPDSARTIVENLENDILKFVYKLLL